MHSFQGDGIDQVQIGDRAPAVAVTGLVPSRDVATKAARNSRAGSAHAAKPQARTESDEQTPMSELSESERKIGSNFDENKTVLDGLYTGEKGPNSKI